MLNIPKSVFTTISLLALGISSVSAQQPIKSKTVKCGSESDGGNPNQLYRLTEYAKTIRPYINGAIAESWDRHQWHKNIEVIDCSTVVLGEPMSMKPDNLFSYDAVTCTGGSELYRFAGDQLRPYTTNEIATQYDPDWASTVKEIDCTGLTIGADVPAWPANIEEGDPVKCSGYTNDAGYIPSTTFRFMQGMLHHYTSAAVAFSYDGDWHATIKEMDCTGFETGTPLFVLPDGMKDGDAIQCNLNTDGSGGPNKVYRFTGGILRWYDTPAIAFSWDEDWYLTMKRIDCTNFLIGDIMHEGPL